MTLEDYLLKLRSDFHIEEITPDKIFIVDLNNDAYMSVTNDAENVVAYLYERYGNRRFIYLDTMGNWDELEHTNGRFTGFRPYQKERVQRA